MSTSTFKRTLAAAVLGTTMIAPLVSAQPAHASCTDRSFNFSWGVGSYRYTTWEWKDNDSYVYMTATGGDYNRRVTAHVDGSNNASTRIDASGGSTANVQRGQTVLLTNYVKEQGLNYASVAAVRLDSGGFTVSGLWSPDYC